VTVLDELAETLLRAAAAVEGAPGERVPLHHTMWSEHLRREARAVRLFSLSWRPGERRTVEEDRRV